MPDEIEFLVVGLGNPGAEYENTPHNLGFMVIERLAQENAIRVTRKENFSQVGLGSIRGKRVALAQPQTFMNLSGPAVKGLLERYGLQPDRLLLVYDELAIPWQELRIRPQGSAAGHNGVKSVIGSLGTQEFPRVRLGIRPVDESGAAIPIGDGASFVLAPFRRARMKEVDQVVGRGVAAVESILADGVEKSMAVFNRRAGGLNTEEE
ncbi:MAG: aminoacyl-tRNA hydrolase [Acidobacteriota bacterium]|nr:aminoacyl-tRNA hydrolase [Acidobacteriota bacterium]